MNDGHLIRNINFSFLPSMLSASLYAGYLSNRVKLAEQVGDVDHAMGLLRVPNGVS
jgi:hypothetical protein